MSASQEDRFDPIRERTRAGDDVTRLARIKPRAGIASSPPMGTSGEGWGRRGRKDVTERQFWFAPGADFPPPGQRGTYRSKGDIRAEGGHSVLLTCRSVWFMLVSCREQHERRSVGCGITP